MPVGSRRRTGVGSAVAGPSINCLSLFLNFALRLLDEAKKTGGEVEMEGDPRGKGHYTIRFPNIDTVVTCDGRWRLARDLRQWMH